MYAWAGRSYIEQLSLYLEAMAVAEQPLAWHLLLIISQQPVGGSAGTDISFTVFYELF